MSWLRRKSGPGDKASGDPAIDFVRRVLQKPGSGRGLQDNEKDEDDTALSPPSGIDSTFCYGEESNPCA